MPEKIVNIHEAALITGRSTRTIYLWIQAGHLATYARNLIAVDDLLACEFKMANRIGRPRKSDTPTKFANPAKNDAMLGASHNSSQAHIPDNRTNAQPAAS